VSTKSCRDLKLDQSKHEIYANHTKYLLIHDKLLSVDPTWYPS